MPTVRAKEPFSYDADGYSHNVGAGQLFDSEDPCVKKRAHLFEPVEVAVARAARALETASAAPGERRSRTTTHQPKLGKGAPEPSGSGAVKVEE